MAANEFIERYGAEPSSLQYVDLLYNNVLDRVPDQDGYDFWVGKMNAGLSRADMLIEFSESAENKSLTQSNTEVGFWVL